MAIYDDIPNSLPDDLQGTPLPDMPTAAMAAPDTLSPVDRDYLIRTVMGEAAREPPEGQKAVAAVIMNRLHSGDYGKSIRDVVTAPNQFEPYNTPAGRARMFGPSTDSPAYKAVASAIDDYLASGQDPTNGATHFFSPRAQAALGRRAPDWATANAFTDSIGNHVFFAPNGRVQSQAMTPPASENQQPTSMFDALPDISSDQQTAQGNIFDSLPDVAAPQSNETIPYRTWSDVNQEALQNMVPSTKRLIENTAQPFLHPIQTIENLAKTSAGLLQKSALATDPFSSVAKTGLKLMEYAGIIEPHEFEKYPDAVGKFLKDRYGGVDNLKNTLATDPVGFLTDMSAVLTAGGSLAAKAPGTLGEIGRVTSTIGTGINPLTAPLAVAGKGIQTAGKAASELIGGVGTHTGAEPLQIATRAGYQGGAPAEAFRSNLRDAAPMQDAVDMARGALQNMRMERGQAYRDAMQQLGHQNAPLNFNKITQAFQNVSGVKNFKGQDLSPTTAAIRKQLGDTIHDWAQLDPYQFHTAEGLDALKQKIGNIRDNTLYGSPERVVADNVYHAVKNTIVDQAPEYAKIMKGYEQASSQLKELEKSLSLGKNNQVDTALRKLQSTLRDNVNTSFGRRRELAEYLVQNGAPNLMETLAGQALKPWTARGLGKLASQIGLEMGALLVGGGGAAAAIPMAAIAPFFSPRLMGEAAYYTGVAGRPLKYIAPYKNAMTLGAHTIGEIPPPQKRGGRVSPHTRAFLHSMKEKKHG